MKRFFFKTIVPIFCFALAFASVYLPIAFYNSQPAQKPSLRYSSGRTADEGVEIKFQETLGNKNNPVAKFTVINRKTKMLRYESYGKNNHCSYSFHYEELGKATGAAALPCVSKGIQPQELLPNETAHFLIAIPDDVLAAQKFKMAFNFQVDGEHYGRHFWSDQVEIPATGFGEAVIDTIDLSKQRVK